MARIDERRSPRLRPPSKTLEVVRPSTTRTARARDSFTPDKTTQQALRGLCQGRRTGGGHVLHTDSKRRLAKDLCSELPASDERNKHSTQLSTTALKASYNALVKGVTGLGRLAATLPLSTSHDPRAFQVQKRKINTFFDQVDKSITATYNRDEKEIAPVLENAVELGLLTMSVAQVARGGIARLARMRASATSPRRPLTTLGVDLTGDVSSAKRFTNRLPERLTVELQRAASVGAAPIRPGTRAFADAVNQGTIKFVVTEAGELVITPKHVAGVEISHAVLSKGRPVLAAGEADAAIFGGRSAGMSINYHSGHFQPSSDSLRIARAAFQRAGIEFP